MSDSTAVESGSTRWMPMMNGDFRLSHRSGTTWYLARTPDAKYPWILRLDDSPGAGSTQPVPSFQEIGARNPKAAQQSACTWLDITYAYTKFWTDHAADCRLGDDGRVARRLGVASSAA